MGSGQECEILSGAQLAFPLLAAGQIDDALSEQKLAAELDLRKALTLVALGGTARAVALARQLPAGNHNAAGFRFFAFGQSGMKVDAEALLARPDSRGYWPTTHLLLAVGRPGGSAGRAGCAFGDPRFAAHKWLFKPRYAPIRDESRFAKFLATFGWIEGHARAQAWRKAHPPEKPAAK